VPAKYLCVLSEEIPTSQGVRVCIHRIESAVDNSRELTKTGIYCTDVTRLAQV
jgi:hypothetical protein